MLLAYPVYPMPSWGTKRKILDKLRVYLSREQNTNQVALRTIWSLESSVLRVSPELL